MDIRDMWREIDRLYAEQQVRPVTPRPKLTKKVR